MNFRNYLCLSLSMIGIVNVVAIGLSPQQAFGAEKKPLLKGIITVDETLSPMPDALSPGKVFDRSFAITKPKEQLWYQIPSWLSGNWQTRGGTTYTKTDLLTGRKIHGDVDLMNPQSHHYGRVKDKNLVIWDRAPFGLWRESRYKDLTADYSMTVSGETELLDEDHFVIKSIDFEAVVDTTSNKITSAYQGEIVHTFTRNPDSSVSVHSNSRHYTREGNAEYDGVNDYVMEKVEDIDFTADSLLPWRREFFLHWLNKSGYLDRIKPATAGTKSE